MQQLKALKNWNALAGCTQALAAYMNSSVIADATHKSMLEEAYKLFNDPKHYIKLKVCPRSLMCSSQSWLMFDWLGACV